MFDQQKDIDVEHGLPIFAIPEDGQTLHSLLSILYHVTDELDLHDIQSSPRAVLATRTYKMPLMEEKMKKCVSLSVSKESLRVYILATMLGWNDMAKEAAFRTLSQPLKDLSYTKEFSHIVGADLYRFLVYRFKCAEAACQVVASSTPHQRHGLHKLADHLLDDPDRKSGCIDKTKFSPTSITAKLRICPRGSIYKRVFASYLGKFNVHYGTNYMKTSAVTATFKCKDSVATAIEDAVSKHN
ncbi:hypothetical protein AX15_001632 [Amanita polypyramis BW_CC]|nr:hypothetical protein AX15_001632 [Amanita polypyramis BW_CC]